MEVLVDVLSLPRGYADLLERRARGVLHEEVGWRTLRVGDLEVLELWRLVSHKLLDRRVVIDASLANIERRLRVRAAGTRDFLGAAAAAFGHQRVLCAHKLTELIAATTEQRRGKTGVEHLF